MPRRKRTQSQMIGRVVGRATGSRSRGRRVAIMHGYGRKYGRLFNQGLRRLAREENIFSGLGRPKR